jgi:hypothetical protein
MRDEKLVILILQNLEKFVTPYKHKTLIQFKN